MKDVLNKDKKVLIYCRESRDENYENYERIETQRDMLVSFCKKEGYTNIIDIILDDDISGTNFNRFNTIIKRIKNNEIDVIVFKDSSRLGRNLKESLNFIALLEEHDVEVLFESEEYNEDFFPLLAWFNEQRAKEDSKKIKNVFKHKMENGEFLIRPIYGCCKENQILKINEEQANIVREIFDLYINGKGTYEIATVLNYKQIKTPSQALNLPKQTPVWNGQHIARILNNESYTGTMFYSKNEKKSFKSKKKIYKKIGMD